MHSTYEVREHCDLVMDQYLRYVTREGYRGLYSQPLRVNTPLEFNEIITSETCLEDEMATKFSIFYFLDSLEIM